MIVGVCGFSWSGSGAVLDYLMEFEELQIYQKELTFAYFPDGIGDLDYNLNESCAKFLSSTVSIPRFTKMVNCVLNTPTKGKIKEISKEYVNSITQTSWIGAGQGQLVRHNQWIYWHLGNRLLHILYRKIPSNLCKRFRLYPLTDMYFSINPRDFIQKTQKFTNEVLSGLGMDVEKKIILNQAFPANNPVRYLPYFKDSKAVVVDRDPRDIYIFLKELFPGNSYSVPVEDVKKYVVYYKELHRNINTIRNNTNILYVRFEDMIYNYESTTKAIRDFIGIMNDETRKRLFRPEISMINTRVFEKTKRYADDIKYIENELSNYLYDFDLYEFNPIVKNQFDDNPLTRK